MFAWGDGTILRLLRDPAAERRNEMQAAAMRAASASGLRVPAVVEVTAAMGRPGIVMERIPGTDLLTLIDRRPWTVFRAGRICGEVQAQMHEVQAPGALPPVREVLRRQIGGVEAMPAELRRFALEVRLRERGDNAGEGGLARARRAPQHHRRHFVRLDGAAQHAAGADEVLLAGDLVQRAGAHAGGQGGVALGAGLRRLREHVERLAGVAGRHSAGIIAWAVRHET